MSRQLQHRPGGRDPNVPRRDRPAPDHPNQSLGQRTGLGAGVM